MGHQVSKDIDEGLILEACYQDNLIKQLYDKAKRKYLISVAEMNCPHAHCNLGRIYQNGLGSTKKCHRRAWYHYQKAADRHQPVAEYLLCQLLNCTSDQKGKGVKTRKHPSNRYNLKDQNGSIKKKNILYDDLIEYKVNMYIRSASQGVLFCGADDELVDGMKSGLTMWSINVNKIKNELLDQLTAFTGADATQNQYIGSVYNRLGYVTLLSVSEVDSQRGKEAMDYYLIASDLGCPSADFNISMMHKFGTGVDKDVASSNEFLQKAADDHHPIAQFLIVASHFDELTLASQEYQIKAAWCYHYAREASRLGFATTYFFLAIFYFHGVGGVTKNIPVAMNYLKLAVVSTDFAYFEGQKMAAYYLGYIYECMLHKTRHNYVVAAHFYSHAARLGVSEALIRLGKMFEKRKIQLKGLSLTSFQIAEILYLKASQDDDNYNYAHYRLGKMYSNQRYRHFYNYSTAESYFKSALSEQSGRRSLRDYHRGILYEHGYGTDVDTELAKEFYYQEYKKCSNTYNIFEKNYCHKIAKRKDFINILQISG
ncbi:hypothetical protein TrispH2_010928 [Trichoplax sp. H2]|nr:hypothetical protein TrispH2_010928 [Trichoplax sp. H2]|eukprot:RDD36814.1 hypothetical protein TrispH2_010928 [Trichoplax sp. H2]